MIAQTGRTYDRTVPVSTSLEEALASGAVPHMRTCAPQACMGYRQGAGNRCKEQNTKQKKAIAKVAAKTDKAGKGAAITSPKTKLGQLETMLRRSDGATIVQLSKALDWLPHSVCGAMSGTLKKKGLTIVNEKTKDGNRVYRIGA
ncbi:DUF3489 domain-containing protein [Reyranella sp.]|uniref:DUF3489 domain-containing protein n=1 Tax=Reyranella sp. TaxID=1929291 RepID=UPI002731DC2B|nr:DUF3489 domain-containing protein [Reyranella sp.]MDP2374683.1 DUF3489 domain-containing protein [Reyranella sp.]